MPSKRSLPVWEEWIEIDYMLIILHKRKMSLPVWEEWIEMMDTL